MSKPRNGENIIRPDVDAWNKQLSDVSEEELRYKAELEEARLKREAFFAKHAASYILDECGELVMDEDGKPIKETPEQTITRLTEHGTYPEVPGRWELRRLREQHPDRIQKTTSTILALVGGTMSPENAATGDSEDRQQDNSGLDVDTQPIVIVPIGKSGDAKGKNPLR